VAVIGEQVNSNEVGTVCENFCEVWQHMVLRATHVLKEGECLYTRWEKKSTQRLSEACSILGAHVDRAEGSGPKICQQEEESLGTFGHKSKEVLMFVRPLQKGAGEYLWE